MNSTIFPKRVIGIYGVSGCGKSHALSQIQESYPEFRCIDGSRIVQEIVHEDGIQWNDFLAMTKQQQDVYRAKATKRIGNYLGVTFVAGHCCFPKDLVPDQRGGTPGEITMDSFNDVFSKEDGQTYDAIFYLNHRSPEEIVSQVKKDNDSLRRVRATFSKTAIEKWIQHELEVLKSHCERHNIEFIVFDDEESLTRSVRSVMPKFAEDAEQHSRNSLVNSLKTIPDADVYLLIDGDRTFCPQDTGKLFVQQLNLLSDPLKTIFGRYDDYCFEAFLSVSMWYNHVVQMPEYTRICNMIGTELVTPYSKWLRILKDSLPPTAHPVLVTSGSLEIWKAAITRNDLNTRMSLVAGNHIALSLHIIDVKAKGIVVEIMRSIHPGCHIWAFGDSGKSTHIIAVMWKHLRTFLFRILTMALSIKNVRNPPKVVDLQMLDRADRAFVVLDDRKNRSLRPFIQDRVDLGTQHNIFQLSPSKTEIAHNDLHEGIAYTTLSSVLDDLVQKRFFRVLTLGAPSAMILATQTRRADICGPELQRLHERAGEYVADRLIDSMRVTVDENGSLIMKRKFQHVQGGDFEGVTTSPNVLILPLMRGGEPMARGVFNRFPNGRLIHYSEDKKSSEDLLAAVLSSKTADIRNVIVVDSVINKGEYVRRVLNHLQALIKKKVIIEPSTSLPHCHPRITVLTLVMQHNAAITLPKEVYPFCCVARLGQPVHWTRWNRYR
jgi:uracil phosphoribosyltransferase